jgi:hypothetical protein
VADFPRTVVDGISVSRMIIGTNWFLGYSHTSAAKDKFIKAQHTRKTIADVMEVYFSYGIDTVMGPAIAILREAIEDVQDRTGRKAIYVVTPGFNILPGGDPAAEPEKVFDQCAQWGATFCFPHQSVTDALLDRMHRVIRDYDKYSKMIRDRGMVPGLSTHAPEAVVIADESGADVATYIQLFNAIGFLMQVEVDWVMRTIRDAKKPVMTIKPMAAGRLLPPVGLGFAWNAIREQDMVTVGANTADEAKECIEISLDFLARRMPDNELQKTRSKKALARK